MIPGELSASKIKVQLFDLRHTFESAQPLTFHADYDQYSNSLLYSFGDNVINVGQIGDPKRSELLFVSRDINLAAKEVMKRFRLNDDMGKIYKKINTDPFLDASIKKYEGMRLTLNDPWETTVCFILSQFNNVKRIRGIVRNLIMTYGSDIKNAQGKTIAKSFPTSAMLMNATVKDLNKCGTGFRAKYIKHAAEYCTNNLDLYKLNPNKYDKLIEELMEINGVGEKVANCIALMGYGNMEGFPIDVWVKRTLEKIYFKGKKKSIKQLQKFVDEQWDKTARGYAQQYIFWGGRQMDKEAKEFL